MGSYMERNMQTLKEEKCGHYVSVHVYLFSIEPLYVALIDPLSWAHL